MSAALDDLCEIHNPGPDTREWMIHERRCAPLRANGLLYLGRSEARDGFAFRRSKPPFDVVLGCVGGRGEVFVSDRWVQLKPSQAILFPANLPHAYRWSGPGTWTLWWLVYQPAALLGTTVREAATVFAETELIDLCVRCFLAEHMADMASTLNLHHAALIHAHCARAFRRNIRSLRLPDLWRSVEENLRQPWTNADLARVARMSAETLRRVCHREIGRSPMAHVTLLRMNRACLLLTRSRQPIQTIAEQVGYQDAFAFSVAFKRCVGVSPSTYRKSLEF